MIQVENPSVIVICNNSLMFCPNKLVLLKLLPWCEYLDSINLAVSNVSLIIGIYNITVHPRLYRSLYLLIWVMSNVLSFYLGYRKYSDSALKYGHD